MGTRSLAVATAVIVLGLFRPAFADSKSDIQQKGREAMEAYDLMDYDAAKKSLNQALATAKKAKLDKDPLTAKIHLYLGVAAFASGDTEGAKTSFGNAVAIDPKIQIDPAYKSPELSKLLEGVRTGGGGTPSEPDPVLPEPGDVDCTAVKGLEHTILDTGTLGAAKPIEAFVGSDITPAKVSVMYRTEGTTEFVEAKMTKQGDCKYTGSIPAAAMKGSLIHYYVAAYDGNNKVISGKGSSGSPNIMELAAGKVVASAPGDGEDPIKGKDPEAGGEVSGGVLVGGKAPKVYLALAGGTGFGYVTGDTESGNMVQNCCIGSSLVVLTPELGYYISPKLSIGLAGRIGVPVGANVEGHATIAPGGLLRLRYALSETGEGVRVMGQLGGGILRNTIKLDNATDGMDTDIVAQGPLLVGGGVGYLKRISKSLAFSADLSALAGIAVVDKVGTSTLNNGISADVSLGLVVGF